MAGAPLGNKNAGKAKPWTDAIRRSISRYDAKAGDGAFLNKLADQLLEDCFKDDKAGLDARNELTNRLDGKYPQPIVGDIDNPVAFTEITRTIIKPKQ